MSSGKKKGRTRASLGTPTKINGRRSSNEAFSPTSHAHSSQDWHKCCSKCDILVIRDSFAVGDVGGSGDNIECCIKALPSTYIQHGSLYGAEICAEKAEDELPSSLQTGPPSWPSVCVLAYETMAALRLHCGDWLLLQHPQSPSAAAPWRTTARAWCHQSSLTATSCRPSSDQLATVRLSGNMALAPPGGSAASLVPLRGHCVPADSVAVSVRSRDAHDSLAFVNSDGRFRHHLLRLLSDCVVAVNCQYQCHYLGSWIVLTIDSYCLATQDENSSVSTLAHQMARVSLLSRSLCDGSSVAPLCALIHGDTCLSIVTTNTSSSNSIGSSGSRTDTAAGSAAGVTAAAGDGDVRPSAHDTQMFGVDSVLDHLSRLWQRTVHCATASGGGGTYHNNNSSSSSSSHRRVGVSPLLTSSGVLVYGISGCGKSMLGRWLAARHSCVSISCAQLAGESAAAAGEQLQLLLHRARARQPCFVFMDDIDAVAAAAAASGGGGGGGERRGLVTAAVLSVVDAVRLEPGLALVATAVLPDAVSAQLRRSGRLDCELELPPPHAAARRQLLAQLLGCGCCQLSGDQLTAVADMAHGFVGADLRAAILEAALNSSSSSDHHQQQQEEEQQQLLSGTSCQPVLDTGTIHSPLLNPRQSETPLSEHVPATTAAGVDVSSSDVTTTSGSSSSRQCAWPASCCRHLTLERLAAAVRRVRPSALRQLVVEVPRVRWCDIAGQHQLKLRLQQAVEWPLKRAAAFRRLGIRAPRGLLMYGPPGCSKTMIARALATESALNFIAVKGPELFSKWVGESERAVRALFTRARQAAPSVVFIDEIDALAVKRAGEGGGGGHSVGERVLAQLLTEMDGVVAGGDPGGDECGGVDLQQHVMVVAATNRPDLLDPALLRPGRLDALVHVPLPDAETRLELLQLRLARVPLATAGGDAVDLHALAAGTHGYSGAEVVAVCQEAGLRALQRTPPHEHAVVTQRDFCDALDTVTPRVTDYHLVYEEFHSKRRLL